MLPKEPQIYTSEDFSMPATGIHLSSTMRMNAFDLFTNTEFHQIQNL